MSVSNITTYEFFEPKIIKCDILSRKPSKEKVKE